MAEETIFLDESFSITKYNNAAPLAGLPLLKRRESPRTENVRVVVTNKRIVVDEKMTVLANIAAVSVGDDAREVDAHNAIVDNWESQPEFQNWKREFNSRGVGAGLIAAFGLFSLVTLGMDGKLDSGCTCSTILFGAALAYFAKAGVKPVAPTRLTPDYAVIIESAGTRDNALISKDRLVVQKIVRAISDALVGETSPSVGATPGRNPAIDQQ